MKFQLKLVVEIFASNFFLTIRKKKCVLLICLWINSRKGEKQGAMIPRIHLWCSKKQTTTFGAFIDFRKLKKSPYKK